MKVYERGGVRLAFEGDDIAVYVDIDKLVATTAVDTPEIEAFRFNTADARTFGSKAWADTKRAVAKAGKDIAAEWRRFQKRRGAK